MVDAINGVLVQMINFLFGPIMLCVYFGVGIMMTIRLKGVQFRRFGAAFRECVGNISGKNPEGAQGQIKSFKALATALSSCVGNGNIVAVSAAIAVGGPGAIFWMWIAAIFGMATKFAEICLAMHYREKDEAGNYRGGVMYILSKGMKQKHLGKILGGAFAVFTVIVSFISCGALQSNTLANALGGESGLFNIPLWVVAVVVLVLDLLVVYGGIKKIANVTTFLTPVMALLYIGFGLIIILMNITEVPTALWYIVKSAFTGDAAVGGVAGATMMFAIQKGVSRGVFSNEAGIGSSAIVHATAQTDQPTRQSLYGIIEVFLIPW